MEERQGGEHVKMERPLLSVLVWPVSLDEAVDIYGVHQVCGENFAGEGRPG